MWLHCCLIKVILDHWCHFVQIFIEDINGKTISWSVNISLHRWEYVLSYARCISLRTFPTWVRFQFWDIIHRPYNQNMNSYLWLIIIFLPLGTFGSCLSRIGTVSSEIMISMFRINSKKSAWYFWFTYDKQFR